MSNAEWLFNADGLQKLHAFDRLNAMTASGVGGGGCAALPATELPDLAIAWGEDPERPEKMSNAAGVEQPTSTYRGDAFAGCEDGRRPRSTSPTSPSRSATVQSCAPSAEFWRHADVVLTASRF